MPQNCKTLFGLFGIGLWPTLCFIRMGDLLEQFTTSLNQLEVGWTRTSVERFGASLSRCIEGAAVGAPLPFEKLSLEVSGVTTEPTPAEIKSAQTGVTGAHMGVADYGSLVIRGGPDATEAVSLFPGLHVAVLRASDVVPDVHSALKKLGPAFRDDQMSVILATGPSATADMGALVRGAHGPKHVHVLIVETL